MGQERIAETLNREGVPVFGSGARWHRSYVAKVLTSPALAGTMVPREVVYEGGRRLRRALDPVEGYYPAVVTPEEREDLQALTLPEGELDLVVLSQSLHHVEEPEAVLREAARLLRPKGKLVVLELMVHNETWVRERLGHRHLGFSPPKLEASLRRAGFASLGKELHAREATSPFRVFLLTGEKQ